MHLSIKSLQDLHNNGENGEELSGGGELCPVIDLLPMGQGARHALIS